MSEYQLVISTPATAELQVVKISSDPLCGHIWADFYCLLNPLCEYSWWLNAILEGQWTLIGDWVFFLVYNQAVLLFTHTGQKLSGYQPLALTLSVTLFTPFYCFTIDFLPAYFEDHNNENTFASAGRVSLYELVWMFCKMRSFFLYWENDRVSCWRGPTLPLCLPVYCICHFPHPAFWKLKSSARMYANRKWSESGVWSVGRRADSIWCAALQVGGRSVGPGSLCGNE